MGRAIVAVIAGVVSAIVIILVIEALGHLIVPVPGSPPLTDKVAMASYLASLPVTAYAFVLLAYGAGCYGGGRIAARAAASQPLAQRCVWIVGALILAATIANLMIIRHPTWFIFADVVIIVVATWAAGRAPLPALRPATGA